MTVRIVPPISTSNPPGKLAEVELHFDDGDLGDLKGLKLIGFAIWRTREGGRRNVTFPARQYSVNGERRSFALLRPTSDSQAVDHLRDRILAAYDEHLQAEANSTSQARA